MSDSEILKVINENLRVSDKYIIVRDKEGNIIFPKDLETIKDVERLMKFKICGREFYDADTGNHYVKKSSIICHDDKEFIFDLIENNNKFKKIEEKSKFDDTTSLLNKDAIMTVLDKYILNREKNIESLAIIVCDIDKFKNINDTYGHLAGDQILERISDVLKDYATCNCSVGRFGGDEFVLIVKNNISSNISRILERLRRQINDICIVSNDATINNITMSFGVYCIDEYKDLDFHNLNSIISERRNMFYQADEALYESKQNGRNKVTIRKQIKDNSYIVTENNENEYKKAA